MTVQVSVVVPTYRRPDLLDRCLRALAAQALAPSAYEIIVADDEPSEGTRRLVESWAARLRPAVRYVPVTGAHGPAAARNAGWRAARGPVIAFTDDDTVPDPNWLKAGCAALDDQVTAVWGRLVMPLPARPTDYELSAARLARAEFVTANCFCRRSALAAVGGFDERFKAAWREDSDLYFRLLELPGRIEHAPGAVVIHPIRPAPWGISLRQQRNSVFDALLYKKHPELYREKIGTAPYLYYAILVCSAGAIVGALGRRWPLAASGAAMWALLTGAFCWRRLRRTARAPRHIAEMVFTSALIPPVAIFWRILGGLKYRVFFY
jgi:glycosyltransferase involved in cell wall biosynthesis